MGGSRQTVLHTNPSHPINSTRNGAALRKAKASKGGRREPSTEVKERRSVSASPPRGGVVTNTVTFNSFSSPPEGDGGLENENKMLHWRVQQLQTSGEQYRQKVETLYINSQTAKQKLKKQIEDMAAGKKQADEQALQTASDLAVVNTHKENLDAKHTLLRGVCNTTTFKISESTQKLERKSLDCSLRQAELENLNKSHEGCVARIKELEDAIRQVRMRRKEISAKSASLAKHQAALSEESLELTQDLKTWNSITERLTAEARSLVGVLDAAAADCTQLQKSCSATGQVRSPDPAQDRLGSISPRKIRFRGSPPSTPRLGSDEVQSLRRENRVLTMEARRVQEAADVKLSEAAERESEWSALCKDWEDREKARETQWKSNLSNILFSE